ncbi:putative outer membrane starch-binding protein [Pontibacter ummariensis]|uniref:Starch-binding associating with outer membrane n=1 Tax=Pontibacter ummariensis TaxID=1610492 RepID=A0A239IRF7_9BACT|nr:RagB/SusD family nutrient uptake outer membrane protein [Pontibacter ummariensis]PRY09681.1 putative outer membrane starch-binding protein [Pontibacter ummariensis]SNS96149.1 Starch-binding associating with outer membrane [Pontibacter ummariensis]
MKNIFYSIKRNSFILISTLAIGGLYSCSEDFLDVEPEGVPVGEDFFVTGEHAMQAVNSIYGNLREWNNIAFAHLAITTITSDNAEKGSVPGDAGFLDNFDNLTVTPTEGQLNGYWNGQYQGINLANQVLTNVPQINMDESLKARLLAEAKFFRAYHYFNLVRAFGGVPLRLSVPLPGEQEDPEQLNLPRASKEDVYAQIVEDLREAAQVLPVNYDAANEGRATKGAALGMLAKVQLYQKNWQEVLDLTEQIMGLGYSLTPNYYDIFRISGENNNESIFEIQAATIPGNCGASNSQWAEVQGVRGQFGWGFVEPTQDLVEAYEEGDERLDATILFRGETTPEGDVISESAPNPRYNQKAYVPSFVTNECGYGRDQNIRILRFAEVLLMHAEAANELGRTEQALETLNMVRVRAGLEPIESATQEELRNLIWQERRVELALENGDRFFDLVRQGRAAEVLQALGKNFVEGKNEVFPIPQQQINLSGGTLTQNPGY